jgi:hypothetical protein
MIKQTIAEELRAKKSRDNRELLDRAADYIETLEREKAEVAREIFEEIEKIIEKHHSECYEYEDGAECDTAITYISYLSVDIDDLKKKYTEAPAMQYKPKIIAGRVKDTGYPIDGHVLTFSQWDYDNRESWHLYGWDEASDEAVMLTMYQAEKEAERELTGEPPEDTLEDFMEIWKAGEWEPDGAFCLPLDKVEVVTVLQEEEPAELLKETRGHKNGK